MLNIKPFRGKYINAFTLVAAALVMVRTAPGEDSAQRRFLEEYPLASKNIQKFYCNLRMVGRESMPIPDSEDPPIIREWEFLASGASLRWDEAPSNDGSTYSIVADPDLSFKVRRDSSSSRYTIVAQASESPESYGEYAMSIRLRSLISNAPYCILGQPILDFISEKHFEIINVETFIQSGEQVAQVDWENSVPGEEKRRGSFTFLPEAGWVLRHFEFYFVDHLNESTGIIADVGRYGNIIYEGERNGFPLVKEMQFWTSGSAGESPKTIYEVVELDLDPVPQEEFTLVAFGIRTDPVPEPIPVMYYLLALSLACTLLVIVFRYLQRRSRHR